LALADKSWTCVPFDEVVLEWCRAERDSRLLNAIPPHEMPAVDGLLKSGDTADLTANRERFRRLWDIRGGLLMHIPADTIWFNVEHLADAELDELRVIYHCQWDNVASHRNELRRVATLMPEPLKKPPLLWERPILWGHTTAGPFTILEGNNRLIGYASQDPSPGLAIPVLVGLSQNRCAAWHILDALS
jgi:hypothetical protein